MPQIERIGDLTDKHDRPWCQELVANAAARAARGYEDCCPEAGSQCSPTRKWHVLVDQRHACDDKAETDERKDVSNRSVEGQRPCYGNDGAEQQLPRPRWNEVEGR